MIQRKTRAQDIIRDISEDHYGRDSRVSIHDVVNEIVSRTIWMNLWCRDIGLCVVDGKLCAVYQDSDESE